MGGERMIAREPRRRTLFYLFMPRLCPVLARSVNARQPPHHRYASQASLWPQCESFLPIMCVFFFSLLYSSHTSNCISVLGTLDRPITVWRDVAGTTVIGEGCCRLYAPFHTSLHQLRRERVPLGTEILPFQHRAVECNLRRLPM